MSGAVQVVPSLASRIAFSAYACMRALDRSGAHKRLRDEVPEGRFGIVVRLKNNSANRAQSSGISDSTASRARTSSPRLVSWVDSPVMEAGCRRSRNACSA